MASILEVTNGTTTLLPGTTWAAPNGLFGTTADRNDGSIYGWADSNATITLPSSGLADGYLFLWGFEHEDTSNGRHNPVGRMVQASGTGNFVSANTGGYARDTSEDRAYVAGWSFVDNPSASATFQFQWKRDTDAPTGGTVRSFIQAIPFYYSDIGLYTSTSTTATGGTTPTQITGFTGTDGTNITITSNQISVTGDNKRYLCLGAAYHEGMGGTRTQRWFGFEIDGTFDDAAKGCMYYRNSANDIGGESFIRLIETATATRTIELNQYRGDGVAAGQGGADVDGNTTSSVGAHSMVVIELNDSAEVWSSTDETGAQEFALTGPVDVNIARVTDVEFNDSASFTRASDIAVDCASAMDVFAFANVSHAREASSIGSGTRWTVHGEFTIGGTEQTSVGFHGNYNRGNQSTQDCHGSSTNQAGVFSVTAGQDIGVSNQELTGTEGGGGDIESQPGWVGFGLINLDTLQAAAATTMTAEVGTYSLSGTDANTEYHPETQGEVGTYALTGTDAGTNEVVPELAFDGDSFDTDSFSTDSFGMSAGATAATMTAEVGTYSLSGADANTEYSPAVDAGVGSYSITGTDAGTTRVLRLTGEVGAYSIVGTDANTESDEITTADVGSYAIIGEDAATLKSVVTAAGIAAYLWAGAVAATEYDRLTTAEVGSYAITGEDALTTTDAITSAEVGNYAYTGTDAVTARALVGSAGVGSYSIIGADATTSTAGGISFDNLSFDPGSFSSDSFAIEDLATLALTAEVGAYALVGTDAATLLGYTLEAEVSGYTIIGTAANTEYNRATDAGVGAYTLSGEDAATSKAITTVAEVGVYSVTGENANTEYNRETDADVGSYLWVGEDVTTPSDHATAAEVGSYALSGTDAGTLVDEATDAEVGSYTLTGTDAGTVYEVLTAEVASYIYNGQVAVTTETEADSFDNQSFDTESFNINSFALFDFPVTNAEVGAYTLIGEDAATIGTVNTPIAAGPANYSITGTDAFLIPDTGWTAVQFTVNYAGLNANSPFAGQPTFSDLVAGDICAFETTTTPSGNTVTMAGDGEFTISLPVEGTQTFDYYIYDLSDGTRGTTEQITVLGETVTVAEVGAYSLTGEDAGLIEDEALDAEQGAYAWVGTDAITGKELSITIGEVGTYTLTGEDAITGKFGTIMPAEVGSYEWTGENASVYKSRLVLESGAYTLTGLDATTRTGAAFAPVTDGNTGTSVSNNPKGDIKSANRTSSLAGRRRRSIFKPNKRNG